MGNRDNPPGLYPGKRGVWIIDKVVCGDRIKLSTQTTDLGEASALLADHVRRATTRQQKTAWDGFVEAMFLDQKSWLHRTAKGMAYRGQRMGKGCDMTANQLRQMLLRCAGRCEVTGIALSFERVDPKKTPPYQPSIDRANSALGYNAANCRVVALAVNLAMREWGAEVITRIGKAMFLKELQAAVTGDADGEVTYPNFPTKDNALEE